MQTRLRGGALFRRSNFNAETDFGVGLLVCWCRACESVSNFGSSYFGADFVGAEFSVAFGADSDAVDVDSVIFSLR